MLRAKRQNVHGSKLPEPGTLGYIVGAPSVNPQRRCMVSHFPLCDSADYRYSIGIHTMFVRFLDDRSIHRFSGHWFTEERPHTDRKGSLRERR